MNKSIITFILIIAYSWKSLQADPIPPNPVQAICAKAPNPDICSTLVNIDPRNDLKTTPQGVAIILIDQAKSNIVAAKKFITENLPNVQEADAKQKMSDCLKAYESAGPDLEIDPANLQTPDGRSDAGSIVDSTEMDLSYDCEWQTLKNRSPVTDQLSDLVHAFSNCLESAAAILTNSP